RSWRNVDPRRLTDGPAEVVEIFRACSCTQPGSVKSERTTAIRKDRAVDYRNLEASCRATFHADRLVCRSAEPCHRAPREFTIKHFGIKYRMRLVPRSLLDFVKVIEWEAVNDSRLGAFLSKCQHASGRPCYRRCRDAVGL